MQQELHSEISFGHWIWRSKWATATMDMYDRPNSHVSSTQKYEEKTHKLIKIMDPRRSDCQLCHNLPGKHVSTFVTVGHIHMLHACNYLLCYLLLMLAMNV